MKTERGQIKRFALRALLRMDGRPMPDSALRESIRIACTDVHESDLDVALSELESSRLICGDVDEITGLSWTLTTSGQHKAKQL